MRFKSDGQWNSEFKHDGLLFFSQRLEEMLFYYTSHLYKVPVNNSISLIREYLQTSDLIAEKAVNEGHLKYILEEFIDCFENDIVIKNSITEDKVKYILQRLNSSSELDQKRIMQYLYRFFSNYDELCVSYLKKIVKEEKEKKKIERALKCYLPVLLNGGYSQEFVYNYNVDFFKTSDDLGEDAIDKFLNRFDFIRRKYKVYFALNQKAKQFEDILEARLGIKFEEDIFSDRLKVSREDYIIASFEVKELDENKAAQYVHKNVNLFVRFYKFLGNRRNEWFYNKCLVRDENDNCVFAELVPKGYSYSEDFDDRTIGVSSEGLITGLFSNAHDVFKVIDKVLQIHNMAISNPDMKNSFLNLWSIIEIIGVNKRDESKMAEIEKAIIPILQKDYAKEMFEELHDYLKGNIPERQYNYFIGKIEKEVDEYKKIACLVVLDEYAELRKEINSELVNYPIIRSRIAQINDMLRKKSKYIDELERYTKRVKWHLRRMYRTRNAIIHSGDTPHCLKLIGEHLHSYIDEILLEITVQLATSEYCTIDNVLINSEFLSDEIKKQFSSKEKVEYADILKLWS